MDEGLLDVMREDLGDLDVSERKMFGGVSFMHQGNMVCGVHSDHGTYRVGKNRQAKALAIDGVAPFRVGTRGPMGGMVMADAEVMADDDKRAELTALAILNVRSLPAK